MEGLENGTDELLRKEGTVVYQCDALAANLPLGILVALEVRHNGLAI